MFRRSCPLLAAMKSIDPLPKRLIICCDGTWQSSVSGKRNIPSNVARLARTIAKAGQDDQGKQWQQIVYYDSGVGTGSLAWVEQARQGGTGDGLVVNVLEAYNFLVNNYAAGDQIYCFGFSRGAFTARAIAGLVTDIGIFKPRNMQSFAPLWAAYQKNIAKHDFRKTKEWFEFINGVRPMVPEGQENVPYTRKLWEVGHKDKQSKPPLPIWENSNVVEVVGVFDTVGSLGLADTRLMRHVSSRKKFEYLNVKLSPFINHAFHALALDDHREPFLPTLWYIPNEATLKDEEAAIASECNDWPDLKAYRKTIDDEIRKHQAKHKPDLYQVWFPGVHINIGGGSDDNSADAEGLSNITFAWMVQQLGPYLAFEPWTWGDDGIAGYQKSVMLEESMYNSMKSMTRQEQKEYRGLITKTEFEKFKDAVSDWTTWIWKGMRKAFGASREVKLVPVQAKITDPQAVLLDDEGNQIFPRWGLSDFQDSYTAMYKVMGAPVNRRPGESHDRSREGGKLLKELGQTNEYIHPSVWWRYQTMKDKEGDMKYVSKALLNFKRQQDLKYGSYGYWKKDTEVWIPEWFMKPSDHSLKQTTTNHKSHGGSEEEADQWQHAEWTYLEGVDGTDGLQKDLVEFYVAAQKAQEKMNKDGREFPFQVTKEIINP